MSRICIHDRATLSLVFIALALSGAGLGCSEEVGKKSTTPTETADAGTDPGTAFTSGEEVKFPVGDGQRVYVKLASPPAVVTPSAPTKDTSWDLAFEGLDVYTNSGASGPGGSSSFGPLDAIAFLDDAAPAVPFLSPDRAGGAFNRWYFYEGPPNHALYSRYHVYAVKDGAKTWKVQVLSYYGERDGAPVSGLYKVRWAEVLAAGSGAVQQAADLDGTAGGPQGAPTAPSECLDLGTGARAMLTPDQARASSAWHLCFRRQDISVNGEFGGPRNVGAVDLDADKTATETLTEVVAKTDASEQARFDAVNQASLAGLTFRGDRIVSAFSGLWLARGQTPAAPAASAWFVVGADGKSKYIVGFPRFEGASATVPGTVVMRVKSVK